MGGLVSSTLLTLIVLPYINDGVEGLSLWARRAWRASDPGTTANHRRLRRKRSPPAPDRGAP